MRLLWCWRCKMEIPMLDEDEWAQMAPLLRKDIARIKAYLLEHRATLQDAIAVLAQRALAEYERMTGFHETNANALWHHRLSLYGPDCRHCGKPLRTPQARHCAACGSYVEN